MVGTSSDKSGHDHESAGRQSNQHTLQERIESAAAVVAGTVREIRQSARADHQSGGVGGLRISEHDPAIAEAVITVTDGIKGADKGTEIVVRFPTSNDVLWHAYPKFKVGQTGVFILGADALTGGVSALVGSAGPRAFTVLERGDVLPMTEVERVRSVSKQSR